MIATPSAPARSGTTMAGGPPNPRARHRVLLVDDHAVVRAGLGRLIDCEPDMVTCGEADDPQSALAAIHRLQPDVALVDWSLRAEDAAELIRTLRQEYPATPVLVLSMHDEVFYAERALAAGARGYLMKQEAADRIVTAIRQVASGRMFLTERAAAAVPSKLLEDGVTGRAASDGITMSAGGLEPGLSPLKVSIVIPVYNGERTVGAMVAQLLDELGGAYHLQIVLVDDGSKDGSARVCRQLHERHPESVEVVFLARNFGEHNAVMAGLNCADGDYCVIMDDDQQNPPAEVRKLVEEIRKGRDVVYARYSRKFHSAFRNWGSRLHNWMATRVLGKPSDLYLSSFKVLSRFLVREAVRYIGPDPYLDAIILRATGNIGTVTVRHEPRHTGRSGYTLRKLVGLWGTMIVAFSMYPMRLMGLVGLALAIIGLVYGALTLISVLMPSVANPDTYQRLNATMWFLRGVTLLFLSVLGEYIGRIHMHLNRDPQYIIRSILRRRSAG